jgi:sodium/proline symporter
MQNPVILVELVLYLVGMLAIGYYFSRKQLTQADYHCGGKRLSGWALALSERSTGESAWLILGLTGAAFSRGLAELWVAFGCVAGILVAWIFLARKFREEADRYHPLTSLDYFASKYRRHAHFIRWFASLIIVFFYVIYVWAQFQGSGKVLEKTFGINPVTGILLSAVVTILYSMAGGFLSVVWTDVVQAILMIVTFIVTPVIALVVMVQSGVSIGGSLTAAGPGMNDFFGGQTGGLALLTALAGFSWFFGYLGGQPQLSTRWMAMRNDADVRRGCWVASGWTLLAYGGALFIGYAALALYGRGAVADPEKILPFMLQKLVPTWLGGILLVGAIAAIMSTASSLLLLVTSCISEDILHKSLNRQLTDRQLVAISRLTILVTGSLALVLSLSSQEPIFNIVSWVWAGIGCSFSPAVLLSFYWKRFSGAGVVAAMLSGFIITVIWMTTGLHQKFSVMVVSFLASLLMGILFALLFPERQVVENRVTA